MDFGGGETDGGDLDFGPLTKEGKEDINNTLDDDNEFKPLVPRKGETTESWVARFKGKFGGGYRYAINRFKRSLQN